MCSASAISDAPGAFGLELAHLDGVDARLPLVRCSERSYAHEMRISRTIGPPWVTDG
jgi:hypothetical protein